MRYQTAFEQCVINHLLLRQNLCLPLFTLPCFPLTESFQVVQTYASRDSYLWLILRIRRLSCLPMLLPNAYVPKLSLLTFYRTYQPSCRFNVYYWNGCKLSDFTYISLVVPTTSHVRPIPDWLGSFWLLVTTTLWNRQLKIIRIIFFSCYTHRSKFPPCHHSCSIE